MFTKDDQKMSRAKPTLLSFSQALYENSLKKNRSLILDKFSYIVLIRKKVLSNNELYSESKSTNQHFVFDDKA